MPYDWWSPLSSEILLKMLSSEESSDWLFSHPHPWPALVLRPIGEPSNAPGLENFLHPGFDPELYPLLVRRLREEEEEITYQFLQIHYWTCWMRLNVQ